MEFGLKDRNISLEEWIHTVKLGLQKCNSVSNIQCLAYSNHLIGEWMSEWIKWGTASPAFNSTWPKGVIQQVFLEWMNE